MARSLTMGAGWALLVCLALTTSCRAHDGDHVSTVHVVFGNHLDVGFDGIDPAVGTDDNVINVYFHHHFPKALAVARFLRQRGGAERYIYTTHSWLVSMFLDCPARIGIKCPSPSAVQELEEGIRAGDITWHALPHNSQIEAFDAPLLRWAVDFTHALDAKYGQSPRITMSQMDVPGLTRAAIPILHGAGVRALSVGVNGGSAPPDVPLNTPFWWEDRATGTRLLSFWHPGGYSGDPVDGRGSCVRGHGHHEALCVAWRGDNAGPHSVREVDEIFELVRKDWPGAMVKTSTFDNFTGPLLEAAKRLDLPKVAAEIGDTWIHGIGSDPGKLAEFRALLRMRRAAPELKEDPAFDAFSRLLLKVPEHTWGVDIKKALMDYTHWSNHKFHQQLRSRAPNFLATVQSWLRQRAYNLWAVQELGNCPMGVAAWAALGTIQSGKTLPDPEARHSGFIECDLASALVFEGGGWKFEIDRTTGGLAGVERVSHDPVGGAAGDDSRRLESRGGCGQQAAVQGAGPGGALRWANSHSSLARVVYSTYSEDDYSTIWDRYAYQRSPEPWWFALDFGKPNATRLGGAARADVDPVAQRVWAASSSEAGIHVVTRSTFPAHFVGRAGAPAAVWTEVRALPGSDGLLVDILWENKTATRLPETLWVRWSPSEVDAQSWVMYKLGTPVSPLEVLRNGSHAMHAVGDEGVAVSSADGTRRLAIRSLDAALVSPGAPTPFPVLDGTPAMEEGMSFALTNNIWGTNYPMWVPYKDNDSNMRFRFILQEEVGNQQGPMQFARERITYAAS
ncbi:hypothetical protein ACKKBG_A29040 [Auxenochlorella protothecoides x Auxenochlorella symbiontica]